MKKLLFGLAVAIGLFASVASAQTITGANLWKLVSGNTVVPVISGWKIGNSSTNGAFNNLTVTGTCSGCGGAGSQTPWTSNIDASYFNLNHALTVNATNLVATSSLTLGTGAASFYEGLDSNSNYGIAATKTGSTITAPYLTLTGAGYLGVGTSSPATNLSVQGNGYLTGRFGIGSSLPTSQIFGVSSSSVEYLKLGNTGGLQIGKGADISGFGGAGDGLQVIGANSADLNVTVQNFSGGFGVFQNLIASSNYVAVSLNGTGQTWNFGQFGGTQFQINDITNSKVPFSIDSNTPANTFILKSSGNVGIGTSSPSATLDVNGLVRVYQTATTTCSASNVGSVFYNSGNSHFWGCNGTVWNRLDN